MSPQKPLERISGIIPDFCLWKWLYCLRIYARSLDFAALGPRDAISLGYFV